MARILLLYASRYGQTERIARRIADVLRQAGHLVTLLDKPVLLGAHLDINDAVVVGGSVQIGRHDSALERAVAGESDRLLRCPNAFFSVSMSAAHPGKGLREAQRCVEQFVTRTGWQPRLCATFAGELAYTRYKPWIRWIMRFISKRAGGSTDTSRDHEYTDWAAVERFAREFAATLPELWLQHAVTRGPDRIQA